MIFSVGMSKGSGEPYRSGFVPMHLNGSVTYAWSGPLAMVQMFRQECFRFILSPIISRSRNEVGQCGDDALF